MTTTAKEIKLGTPTPYDGNRDNLDDFLMEVEMYIQINDKIYDTDKKKIIFALSYMKEGTAGPWKQNFWATEKLDDQTAPWTWTRFKDTLKASFAPPDRPGEALTLLITERQGNRTVDEFIAEFKINASQSGLKEDLSLIKWFSVGINPQLARKIRELERVPSTIQEWYDWASKLDLNFR